ncbi:hypothetical protein GOP47_0007682 [Adiantum capillus-veneris]|uniref:Protein GPR107 n=1 Tax=Adiantum capillus-veneris TaxID=13818 RepID=A0A9D4ZJG4_ADICA|nr:hypothetical protein GOP47_0007682 [Adiantum capillus-veneris]
MREYPSLYYGADARVGKVFTFVKSGLSVKSCYELRSATPTASHGSLTIVYLLYKSSSAVHIFLALCVLHAEAGINELSIKDDSRDLIVLEQFGFTRAGRLEIEVKDVKWSAPSDATPPDDYLQFMGFFLASEDDRLQVSMELEQKIVECVLQSSTIHKIFTFKALKSGSYKLSYPAPGSNLYTLMFANCLQGVSISMSVKTVMYNLEGNTKDYLSEGQTQLPALYFSFFWIYVALADTEDKFYIKKTGTPHGWDVAFYAFSFLKGVMLFTVIVLIGTGWSILKPFLQGKEKKVLMIVIPLQVLANTATVVVGESGLSGKNWLTWKQLFLLVDVICCCAVLFPIVWSIKHLREAARTDGKAARNLVKLTLFRQYYIVVVTYIYFTRIVVFALQTVTSYHYTWVSELARELATLAFYVFTGYNFRPVPHNPYFVLDEEEEEAAMEALKDDDFEL